MKTENIRKGSRENTSFGAVHLKVSSLEKATLFWTNIAGLKLRKSYDDTLEFGTLTTTLVVTHKSAQQEYLKGYSGLYHFAIHVPDEAEFASVINRLNQRNYPHSPVDHTISKAVYFSDFEGITVEYTLETSGSEKPSKKEELSRPKSLNVDEVLLSLEDNDVGKILDDRSFIGHIHLYAYDVDESNDFYQSIGFIENNYKPHMAFADLGAGGDFGHRIALNSWHGRQRPLAPTESAGLDYFQLTYNNKDQLNKVLEKLSDYQETDEGYWVKDPTGNRILLN